MAAAVPGGSASHWRQLAAVLALAVFLALVLWRFAEIDRLWQLLTGARPGWIALAVALQATSLACTPVLWWLVLRRAGHRHALRSVLPLAYTKTFVDHLVPSGGISGSATVARSLVRQGAPRPAAVAAILLDFIAYFLGYALAVAATLLLLRQTGHLNGLAWAVVGPFSAVALLVPLGIYRMTAPGDRRLPGWLGRFAPVARFVEQVRQTPPALVRQPRTLVPAAALRLLVFVLNAGTLAVLLLALGRPTQYGAAFAAVVMGSLVTTIGPLPGGLGSYEAASVGTLVLFGAPTEEALAAVLLLRGLSFWAPMLPGFWFLRAELAPLPGQRRSTSESNSVPVPSMACSVSTSPSTVMYRKWQTDSEKAVKSD